MIEDCRYSGGKHAAVVISFDDVFPAYSVAGEYFMSEDTKENYLELLSKLLKKHQQIFITLFTVPDWREKRPFPSRQLLSHIPILNNNIYLSPIWPKDTFSLPRHPGFCQILRGLPRVEIAVHGLHHVSKGNPVFQEFNRLSYKDCLFRLQRAEDIFKSAGLSYVKGFAPPGWKLSRALLQALQALNYSYLASARDLNTEIKLDAITNESGVHNLPLIFPTKLENTDIVHIPANWSITSTIERADQILELGGVLSIKAHAVKYGFGFTAKDGFDEQYLNYLDKVFDHIEKKWTKDIWWTSMGSLAERFSAQPNQDNISIKGQTVA